MARGSVMFGMAGARAHAKRLIDAPKRVELVLKRAKSTLLRQMRPEAARLISSEVLNLPARKVSANIRVESKVYDGADYIVVSAARRRLPLADYTPSVSKRSGTTVTTWREKGAQSYPHAFRRRDKAGIWQRIPDRNGGPSGLAHRLPIVQRMGPSLHRVFEYGGRYAGHGDIRPRLGSFAQSTLATEIARQLRVARNA